MVDARDFVDGYVIRIKNGGMEVTKQNLAILRVRKNEMGRFLFEGRHWRMDVCVLELTIDKGRIVRY